MTDSERLAALERRVADLERRAAFPFGSDVCTDGGQHDYPQPYETTAGTPTCRKCGKMKLWHATPAGRGIGNWNT